MIFSRPVKARISRSTDMQASVPLFTKRTISTLGTAAITSSASWFSSSQGAPKLVPLSRASCRAAITSGWAWPQIAGPQLPM
jgi:hypothetical protein